MPFLRSSVSSYCLVAALSLCGLRVAGQEYPSPADLVKSLREMAAAHSGLLEAHTIATSRGGTDVVALTLAAPGARPPQERQALLVTAGLDAGMLHTTETAVGMLSELLRRRNEPEIKALLEQRTVYWVPLANPDGAALTSARPLAATLQNARPTDDDRDGRVDEDGPEDLDGDGEILTLLVPDPDGAWTLDAADERMLLPAAPAERNRARYRLLEEGIDNDGDGQWNEDPPGGVDLARNFPHEFEPRASGSGPYPACEAETKALLDFVIEHSNIDLAVHYGGNDNLIQPPAPRDGPPAMRGEHRAFKEDAELLAKLGERYKKTTGVAMKAVHPAPRGAWHETLYFELGIPCLAACLFGSAPPIEGDAPTEKRWLEWNDSVLKGGGFVKWRPFEHPQLGQVLLGGWRPYARMNPPRADAAKLAVAQAQFLIELSASLSRLSLESLRVKDLGEGIFEVKARIANMGDFPTAFVQGAYTARRSPLHAAIVGEGLRFLTGDARKARNRLEPRGSVDFTWLVAGARSATVKLEVKRRGLPLLSTPFQLVGGGSL